ncbi:hydroxymethylbilane synthase [Pelagibacterium limicola]|uniref:hydroxymethylbilane synthase n=1 Tax=Pelagibacterium limicola TaxID=2791022 RepID=UPI0018B00154|nr:hydroxymethylbilane synthase [Pelagibacterium limicola]
MQSQPTPLLTIGTRGSPLALAQAHEVRDRLCAIHGFDPETLAIKVIRTSGDAIQDKPLAEVGGKGLFTKEIEEQLLSGEIDLAVHSSKDMPTRLPDGLVLSAFLEREDVRDAFISLIARSPDHLPEGARIGTSSLRRAAQMKRFRGDFRIVPFRGNVQTRLKKLADGQADATLLALAGLNRLGENNRATLVLDEVRFPPAPAQGAICIETRTDDTATGRLVAALDHPQTRQKVEAERGFLASLDGSCRTPIAALSRLDGGTLTLLGQLLSVDGQQAFEEEISGDADAGPELGRRLGEKLKAAAGEDFLNTLNGAE